MIKSKELSQRNIFKESQIEDIIEEERSDEEPIKSSIYHF